LVYGSLKQQGCTQKALEQSVVQFARDAPAFFGTFLQAKLPFPL
jgi:hypothetical protein